MDLAIGQALLLASFLGGWEIVFLFALLFLLFMGTGRRGFGKHFTEGIREFKKATEEVRRELQPQVGESGLVYEVLTHDNRTAEFLRHERTDLAQVWRACVLFVAQGLGIGRIPFAPGTFGSLAGLVWFAMLLQLQRYEFFVAGSLVGAALSIWLSGAAERILNQKDPSSVVLDEIIAMPFCFFPWVTRHWLGAGKLPDIEAFLTGHGLLLTGLIFVFFRVFDITKPWPVGRSQRLPGGWGITIDDLLAAVYVAAITLFFPI